jgi:hypothetical protein
MKLLYSISLLIKSWAFMKTRIADIINHSNLWCLADLVYLINMWSITLESKLISSIILSTFGFNLERRMLYEINKELYLKIITTVYLIAFYLQK